MKKNINFFGLSVLYLSLIFFTFLSCDSEKPTEEKNIVVEQVISNSSKEKKSSSSEILPAESSTKSEPKLINTSVPPISKPSKIAQKNIDKQTLESVFKNLGCCIDSKKRLAENCCCAEVMVKYTELKNREDARIAQIKQLDPIFNDCKKDKSFRQQLENLEIAKEEEEEFAY